MLLEGASTIAVDAKGRIAIPARYRDDLEQVCEGKLHITRHFREDCLLLFPESEWVTFRAMVAAWPNSAAWQKRRILGNAMPVELDTASRILLSPDLREEVQMVDGMIADAENDPFAPTKPGRRTVETVRRNARHAPGLDGGGWLGTFPVSPRRQRAL